MEIQTISTEELNSLKDEYLQDLDNFTHKLDDIEKIIDEKITNTVKELYKCYIILKFNTEKRIDKINNLLKEKNL